MTGYEQGSSGISNCPACGAVLREGLEDQFFCEHCGAPLAREPEVPDALSPGKTTLPDWLDELESPPPPSPSSRLVLQPRTPPGQRVAARDRGGSGPPANAVAIFVLLGLLCLGLALMVLVGLGLVAGG